MKQLLLLLLCFPAFAQTDILYKGERINALNAANQRTGVWKVYDEPRNLVAVCEFKDGEQITGTNYYMTGKLIVSIDKLDNVKIYREKDTINAKIVRNENQKPFLISDDGKKIDKNIEKYFISLVNIYPMYYGGVEKLLQYVADNFDLEKTNVEPGTIIVNFILDANGFYSSGKIAQGITPVLDAEALKAVSGMARFQPGHQYGKFVRASYNLPIKLNRRR